MNTTYEMQKRLRMMGTSHFWITQYILVGDYGHAEETAKKAAAILRAWGDQRCNRKPKKSK